MFVVDCNARPRLRSGAELAAAGVILGLLLVPAPAPASGGEGKELFVEQKCNRCHSVAAHEIEATVKSEKMRGPDLSDVGAERSAEWMERYLRREVELDGREHKSEFKGSDEELQGIVGWLATLDRGVGSAG